MKPGRLRGQSAEIRPGRLRSRTLPCAAAIAVWASLISTAAATGVSPASIAWAAAVGRCSSDEAISARPLADRLRVRAGELKVVYFRTATATPFDRGVHVFSDDPSTVETEEFAQIPGGHEVGTCVVRGLRPGQADLVIAGRTLAVDVLPANSDRAGPDLVTPSPGAAIWGTVAIGAEWWRPGGATDAAPVLHVARKGDPGSRRVIQPTWSNTPADGPTARAAFALNSQSFEDATTIEVWLTWSSEEPSGQAMAEYRVVHPTAEAVVGGECEAVYDLPPLPDQRKEPEPNIRKHPKASGGAYFDSAGTLPRFRYPLEVPETQGPGWYQVIMSVAGDSAVGTLPAVGISIDEAQYPVTRAAIAMPAFHRVPIGLPFRLAAGRRVLRVDFLNDFYAAGGADRNLRLDSFEVVRVADDVGPSATPAVTAAGGDSMMMMAGAPSTSAASAGSDTMVASMTGPSPSGQTGWPADAAAKAARTSPPVITFARPIHGSFIAGDLEIRAVAAWPGLGDLAQAKAGTPGPATALIVNGHSLPRQFSAAPRFIVPCAWLADGENRLQLVLQGADISARSPEAVVKASTTGAKNDWTSAPFFRFTVHDPRWSPSARQIISNEQNPPERACFAMYAAGEVTLDLPESLEGEFELELEARGIAFQGAPEVAVSVTSAAEPQPAGVASLTGSWDPVTVLAGVPGDKNRRPAVVLLASGPKQLRLAFINDLYEPDKGDRNAFIQAVSLRPRATVSNATERDTPHASILWPPDGERLRSGPRGAGAIVLAPEGGIPARSAEILIDGRVTGQLIDLRNRFGPQVVPLSLRDVPPGEHDLSVRLDGSTNRSLSLAARRIRVIEADDAEPTRYERAVTLLDRLAFGADERELATILSLGESAWLEEQLSAEASDPAVSRAHTLAAIRHPNSSSQGDVQRRAILEALATERPVRYRFVLFAQNHFSTWIRKTEARRKADEHEQFCTSGIASFDDLLRGSAMSPAMLRYLDQELSFARRLNENYAREIMELHTLGVNGGYTQEDVTTLARVLTGWSTAREPFASDLSASTDGSSPGVGPDEYGMREVFRYDPLLADRQSRVVLGRSFDAVGPAQRHERVLTALSLLAGHPSTARFVSGKVAAHFIAQPAPQSLVDRLASTFERSGGDMRELLRDIAMDPAIQTAPPRLAHPPDFAFRLARVCTSLDAGAVHEFLNLSGHGMFDRSTPDGYQENDSEVTDSNAMLQRWKFARRFEGALFEFIPASRRYGDKPITAADAQNTIDLIALRLTGRLLGASSNTAALELLTKIEGKRDDRWRAVAAFIASTPEVQLR